MARRLRLTTPRRLALGGILGAVLMLVLATVVFACTYIPHLYAVSPTAASPGADLTLTGSGLAIQQPVTLRMNGVHGPVLGTVTPDSQGNFQTTIKVPAVAAGTYFVMADAGGNDVARAAFQVTGGTGAPAAPEAPALAPGTPADSGSVIADAVPAGSSWLSSAMVPGLVLFTVGTVAVVGFGLILSRRRRVPARVR